MKKYIDCCVREFPTINVVVFTGGECTLLKKDLLEAIRYCSKKKKITRIVTNGHWGKLRESARTMLNSLTEAGLNEINLSTGKDHLKYVPLSNIINIMIESSKNENIKGVIISVEKRDDYEGENPIRVLKEEAKKIEQRNNIFIIESPWVSFRERSTSLNKGGKAKGSTGCRNLFSGVQINPDGQLLSCCGLACEYSPLLKLG